MCTIRRARIKKLIKQQRKGKNKGDLFEIDLDGIPRISWKKTFELISKTGFILHEFKPHVKRIRSTRPRNL